MSKICLISSSGGHYEQLKRLKDLELDNDLIWVTEKTEYSSKADYYLIQTGLKDKWFLPKMIANSIKSIKIWITEKPDYVITTGTMIVIPIALLAKIFRKKLIYVETFARVYDGTKAGKLMYKYADLFIIQWESLQEIYPDAIYGEHLLIFVCVGSREYPFDRLLKEIDFLIENGTVMDEVFAQIGQSNYIPKNYKFERFIDSEKFSSLQNEADIIISHGGTGALIGALKKGKNVIAVPRLAKYGEHIDDHQTQVSSVLADKGYLINVTDMNKLGESILAVKDNSLSRKYDRESNVLNIIRKFIQKD